MSARVFLKLIRVYCTLNLIVSSIFILSSVGIFLSGDPWAALASLGMSVLVQLKVALVHLLAKNYVDHE